MRDVYLVNYSVRGIKTIEKTVSLSFYKKTISKEMDTQGYNIKGVYGMNGSGKTAIITSVDIFRNLIISSDYLNNPMVQKNLDAIINKKTEELFIEADYISNFNNVSLYFRYTITLSRDKNGKYIISYEKLSLRKATAKDEHMRTVFEVVNGVINDIVKETNDDFNDILVAKTTNLLSTNSIGSLFYDRVFPDLVKDKKIYNNISCIGLCFLLTFSRKIHVYLDQSDDHREYFMFNSFEWSEAPDDELQEDNVMKSFFDMENDSLNMISAYDNFVHKSLYEKFEERVSRLYEFIRIFKSDLKEIKIEKKENRNTYICSLIMVYDSYNIHAEFESTGIKKLIKLFAYLLEMVEGGIVFIDEFDSNLHDVYLCALLEYLMEYGEGQLCFTTHNVGPMDVLRKNKKSIDFLSEDNTIYSWKTNGNYSPSKLYRNGMIEGSPFNVDSIDFINAFNSVEEDV